MAASAVGAVNVIMGMVMDMILMMGMARSSRGGRCRMLPCCLMRQMIVVAVVLMCVIVRAALTAARMTVHMTVRVVAPVAGRARS
jgi:hypothetical protein